MFVVVRVSFIVYLEIYRHEDISLRFLTARQYEAVDFDGHLVRRVMHGVGQRVVQDLGEPHLLSNDQVWRVLLHLVLDLLVRKFSLDLIHVRHVTDEFAQVELAQIERQLALLDLLEICKIPPLHAFLVVDVRDLINVAFEVRPDTMAEIFGQFSYSLVQILNFFLYKLNALIQAEVETV